MWKELGRLDEGEGGASCVSVLFNEAGVKRRQR